MVGSAYWNVGPSQSAPYGAASSPKGRAKVASLRKNDTAKLPFRKAVGQSREAHCDYPTKVAPPLQTVLKACPMESVVADSAKVELTMKNITTSP